MENLKEIENIFLQLVADSINKKEKYNLDISEIKLNTDINDLKYKSDYQLNIIISKIVVDKVNIPGKEISLKTIEEEGFFDFKFGDIIEVDISDTLILVDLLDIYKELLGRFNKQEIDTIFTNYYIVGIIKAYDNELEKEKEEKLYLIKLEQNKDFFLKLINEKNAELLKYINEQLEYETDYITETIISLDVIKEGTNELKLKTLCKDYDDYTIIMVDNDDDDCYCNKNREYTFEDLKKYEYINFMNKFSILEFLEETFNI